MSDPFQILTRAVTLLFVPAMLLFPLVFALLVPNRARSDSARTLVRARLAVLGLSTALALALWGALLASAVWRSWTPLATLANFSWVLFFPLWFLLALPAIRAKNPVWSGALDGSMAATTRVRVASLGNRERENPVHGFLRWIPSLVAGALTVATAARGLAPFVDRSWAGEGEAERMRWLIALGVLVLCATITLVAVPLGLRRACAEPEPLDPGGSAELLALYRAQRRRRILGLFWLSGVLLPGFLGAMICAAVWLPSEGSLIGLIGALGGSAIGIAGGIFGTFMSIESVKIAEAKARLEGTQS